MHAIDLPSENIHVQCLCSCAMQNSPLRHPVAILRKIIGLGQKELADLVGRSRRTIQAVELGTLNLGVDLADALVRETGVDFVWLVRGETNQPPVNLKGQPYTKQDFELAQTKDFEPCSMDGRSQHWEVLNAFRMVLPLIVPLLSVGTDERLQRLASFKIYKLFEELSQEFDSVSEDMLGFVKQSSFAVTMPGGFKFSVPPEMLFKPSGGAWFISEKELDLLATRIAVENPKELITKGGQPIIAKRKPRAKKSHGRK